MKEFQKILLFMAGTFVLAGFVVSCQKEVKFPSDPVTGSEGIITFGMDPLLEINVDTKASSGTTEVNSLSSFYVTCVTGSAGSEAQVWNSVSFSQVPDSSPAIYAGNKYWPEGGNPEYKFYAANVPLTYSADGTTVSAGNSTDVVVAYNDVASYKTKNILSFEHVFARLGDVTVAAVSGYTLSDIDIRITPRTGGTYNIRAGRGHSDATGWSSLTTGSPVTVASAVGVNNNNFYLAPGDYVVTASWTALDLGGKSMSYSGKTAQISVSKGAVNSVNVALGGQITVAVDISEFIDSECVQNLEPLTFEAIENGNILWKTCNANWTRTIEYSKDGGASWTAITSTTSGAAIPVSAGEKVLIRGNNKEYGFINRGFGLDDFYCFFSFSSPCYVYGNMTDLLANGYKTRLANHCFPYIFSNNSTLRSHPTKKILLPSLILERYCYYHMFDGCTSLTTAPELPATSLAAYCYSYMFRNCSNLTPPPELPATTLAEACYSYMFRDCTSLTTPPELPATTLAATCYYYMFAGCTNLSIAPELPATTLTSNCYFHMFDSCTSLTRAPELPATSLTADFCYYGMFYGCSSLNYIKALFTTTPSFRLTNDWVSGVAATGTFVKSRSATWNVTGTHGVPEGWTVTYDPLLP